jgi:tetratricopeptide (TPR) repeat protein
MTDSSETQQIARYAAQLCKEGRYRESAVLFSEVISREPQNASAFYDRGYALFKLGLYPESVIDYDRSLELKPLDAFAYNNRGIVLQKIRRYELAKRDFYRALEIDPNCLEAHKNLAHLHLTLGEYREGWMHYEWRKSLCDANRRIASYAESSWEGDEDLSGLSVFVFHEQGFGDALQMYRYLPLLAQRARRVFLEVPPELRSLAETLPNTITIITKGEAPPRCDRSCSIMSLPWSFRTELSSIPNQTPYLSVPAAAAAKWAHLRRNNTKPRIGLAWSGNPEHTNDSERSMRFELLRPLLSLPATFISLQRAYRGYDLELLRNEHAVRDLSDQIVDFSDTAAIAESLDLVISVDTSVAHLAGALGIPQWILIPRVPDFRWMFEREDSPWYPNARLFRQVVDEDWSAVVERVRDELDGRLL